MFDIDDLVELEMMLQEVRGEKRIKPRIASFEDVDKLLDEGRTIKETSILTNIPESAIAKYEDREEFLTTGQLSKDHVVYTFSSGKSFTSYS